VKWKGDLDTLRAVVRGLPLETLPDQHLILFWYDRQPDSMLAFLRVMHEPTGKEMAAGFRSRASWAGSAYLLRGDSGAARTAFRAALKDLDSLVLVHPDDWHVHEERGMAMAYLARRAEALREARWLEGLYHRDPAAFPVHGEACANILVQLGDTDAALALLDRILASPGLTSVYTLARTPVMDPVRNDARFRALLEKYGADLDRFKTP
jgi:tetratricopeptide (TPR) repeat protein